MLNLAFCHQINIIEELTIIIIVNNYDLPN